MKRSAAVIFDRFGPYHIARLKAAGERLSVTAIEVAATTSEYAWDEVTAETVFEKVTLFSRTEGDSSKQRPAEVGGRMCKALTAANPECVFVPGWATVAARSALKWCVENDRPAILMSESTAFDAERKWHREAVKRRLVALFSAALVGGTAHIEYLEKLGLERGRVFTGYDVVDNAFFERAAREVLGRNEKANNGLPENYFLASGRFVEKKNLQTLIRAYAEYRQKTEIAGQGSAPWDLVILGDGPLKADLHRLTLDLGVQQSVRMPGFKQYAELPEYYAWARAFIHASTSEQWGLVVNEAMACGLPVLVSNRCGCAADLVSENKNGFTFDPGSTESLAMRLQEMARLSPDRLWEMGDASREIIAQFTPQKFAEGAGAALEAAFRTRTGSANRFNMLLLNALISRGV
jgi:1,2-diacylglycerol 3-alpha-glucosyltransferase